MTEKCPYCGNEFSNTKALGSHIHYVHSMIHAQKTRSEVEEQRFQRLLSGCLSDKGLRKPRQVEKVERAIREIPEGLSPTLDQYRDVFKCALGKEELLKEIEAMLGEEDGGKSG